MNEVRGFNTYYLTDIMLQIALEKQLLERAIAVEPIGETAKALERCY